MDTKLFVFLPGLLDEGSTCYVEHLFLDVYLNQESGFLIYSFKMGEGMGMFVSYPS